MTGVTSTTSFMMRGCCTLHNVTASSHMGCTPWQLPPGAVTWAKALRVLDKAICTALHVMPKSQATQEDGQGGGQVSTPTICLRKAFKQDTQKVLHVQNRHGLGHHCSHNTLNEDILPCRICQCNISNRSTQHQAVHPKQSRGRTGQLGSTNFTQRPEQRPSREHPVQTGPLQWRRPWANIFLFPQPKLARYHVMPF